MTKQMGNSRRGPDDLDRAQGSATAREQELEENESPMYATGDLDDHDTDQLLAEGELVGSWSEDEDSDGGLLAGDESVGPWSEEDLDYGLQAGSDVDDDDSYRGEDQQLGETRDRGPGRR